MISSLEIYQDNKVGDSNLMAVHSPLVFLVDAVYSGSDPYFIYCKLYDGATLLNTFKCIPYKDLTTTKRRFMFVADSILRGYMEDFEDFGQTLNTIVKVEDITKEFKLVFSDPDEVATDVEIEIVAIHAVRQFGENPNLSDIYNNVDETVYAISGKENYLYVYNSDGGEITVGVSYMAKFIISDSLGFLDGATININSLEKTTDTNGEAIYYLNNGTYNYTISKSGYITNTGTIAINDNGIIAEITLTEDTLYTVQFKVDFGDVAIENAEITIDGQSPIYTDSLGIATIDLYSNTYEFTVDAGSEYFLYEDTFILDNADLTVPVELTEATGYSCEFTATTRTGTPLQYVLITLDDTGQNTTTDENGQGIIADILPGTYDYTAQKDGYFVSIGTITINNANISETVIMNK